VNKLNRTVQGMKKKGGSDEAENTFKKVGEEIRTFREKC
jgi:hypothetical protein